MRFQFYCALAVISIFSTSFDTNQERYTFFKRKDMFLVSEKDSVVPINCKSSLFTSLTIIFIPAPSFLLCARMIHDPSIH